MDKFALVCTKNKGLYEIFEEQYCIGYIIVPELSNIIFVLGLDEKEFSYIENELYNREKHLKNERVINVIYSKNFDVFNISNTKK